MKEYCAGNGRAVTAIAHEPSGGMVHCVKEGSGKVTAPSSRFASSASPLTSDRLPIMVDRLGFYSHSKEHSEKPCMTAVFEKSPLGLCGCPGR